MTLFCLGWSQLCPNIFFSILLVQLCYKRTNWCRIFLWEPSLLRQAPKKNALRHIWMAWRRPQGMQTGSIR